MKGGLKLKNIKIKKKKCFLHSCVDFGLLVVLTFANRLQIDEFSK